MVQALKMLVAFMGLLIIAGLGLLGYGLYQKTLSRAATAVPEAEAVLPVPPASAGVPGAAPGQIPGGWVGLVAGPGGADPRGMPLAPPSRPVHPPTPFGTLSLNEPDGTTLQSFQSDGRTLVLALTGGGQPFRLVVVDLASGTLQGRVSLTRAP